MKRRSAPYRVVRVNPTNPAAPYRVVRVNPRIQAGSAMETFQQYVAAELNQAGVIRPNTRFRETTQGGLHVTGIDPYELVHNKSLRSMLRRLSGQFGLHMQIGAGAIMFSPGAVESHAHMNPTFPAGKFDDCVAAVSARGTSYDPQAVCAQTMRRKYGSSFQKAAIRGRRAAVNPVQRSGMGFFFARVGSRDLAIEYNIQKWRDKRYLKVDAYKAANPDTYAIVPLTQDEKYFVEQLIAEHLRTGVVPAKFAAKARSNPVKRPARRAPVRHRVPANADAARELMLFGVNDRETYRHAQAILRNMAAKQARGTYDPQLAVKAWLHWADGAAKNYRKEFGNGSFTPADRHEAARQAVDYYAEEIAETRAKMKR